MPIIVPLGRLVATPNALARVDPLLINIFLGRHIQGDWGELSEADRKANDHAVIHGERVLSSYPLPDGGKVWIITEWDRSVTTVLMPEDY